MKANELKCTDLRIGNYVKIDNILCELQNAYYCLTGQELEIKL